MGIVRFYKGNTKKIKVEIMSLKKIPKKILIKAYELMYTSSSMTNIYEKNKKVTSKYVHATSRGHEAIQIALGMQLESTDWVSPYYRDDALLLSIGVQPYELMLQLMAKKNDPFSGGRSYYSHPSLKRNDMPKIPHQSSATGMQAIPTTGIAMGIQYLEKQKIVDKSEKSIVVCSMGDGSITEGEVSEAFHMAALKQYPILYMIQDNGWDISASRDEIRSNEIVDYIKGYGSIEVVKVEGNDFVQSYITLQKVIQSIRTERRPFLIYANVPLLNHHTSGVRMEWYRDDLEEHQKRDPLPILKNQLRKSGIENSQIKKIESRAIENVELDFIKAKNSDDPDPEELYENIFHTKIVTSFAHLQNYQRNYLQYEEKCPLPHYEKFHHGMHLKHKNHILLLRVVWNSDLRQLQSNLLDYEYYLV